MYSNEFTPCREIQLYVNQATQARWAFYYDVTVPCWFIQLLFANIKFHHTTSHVILANQKQEILEAFNSMIYQPMRLYILLTQCRISRIDKT